MKDSKFHKSTSTFCTVMAFISLVAGVALGAELGVYIVGLCILSAVHGMWSDLKGEGE